MIGYLSTLAAADPVAHVIDKPITEPTHVHLLPEWVPLIGGEQTFWAVSNVTVMLVLGAVVTAAIVIPAARKIATGKRGTIDDLRTQGAMANFVEAICLYLRDEVFKPVLADQTDKYTPMLWTFFWYILVCNLLGLIPLADITGMFGINHGHGIGGTATQSIWVTGALAILAFTFWNGVAFIKDPIGFLKHLTAGSPFYMWPLMVIVELIGMVVKPFALALRLFANMTGGHIIIAVLLGFVPALMGAMGKAVGGGMSALPILGGLAINILEILVAFIQAYIFTFLTCLFLGQLVVHEHDEHDEHHTDDHGVHVDPHTALEKRDVPLQPSHAGAH